MGRKKKRKTGFFVLFLCVMVLFTGCKKEVTSAPTARSDYNYTRPQAMIIVATERNRYEQAYTDAVWEVTLEGGQTFETYLLEQLRTFLRDLKTMNLLADSEGIDLTNAEKERIRHIAEEYYSGLTQDDIQFMGITSDDVLFMYQEYYRANKVVGELTKDVNLEVSDSEAKVISVRQIVLGDRQEALSVHKRVSEEGSDFASIARETTTAETIERRIGRGEEPQGVEDVLLALTTGEISPVVMVDDVYYIFQCVSDYDMDATKERKTQIHEERKAWVFQQIFDQFQENNQVVFSEEIWADIRFSKDDACTTDNFFALYQEEFGSKGY